MISTKKLAYKIVEKIGTINTSISTLTSNVSTLTTDTTLTSEALSASSTIYRLGKLRILVVQGAVPTFTLASADRPPAQVNASGYATGTNPNLYARIARMEVRTTGSVLSYGAPSYFDGNNGFSALNASDNIYATAIWKVS